ncbi:MAG: ABC transporter ATP-binding protein [Bulleidia sp.]
MLKAFRYLKPFRLAVIAVIALVFAQVQCELALPDYMSNIITYGIQYNGVTSSVPEAISVDIFDHLAYFMSDSEYQIVQDSYHLSDTVSIEHQHYSIDTQAYVLNESHDDSLSEIVAGPYLITSMLTGEDMLKSMNLESADQLWNMIEADPAMAQQIQAKAQEQISTFTQENLEGAVRTACISDYRNLGIDIEKVQNHYIFSEGGIMLVIALLGSLAAVASAYLSARAATGAARNMRKDVFEKVESFSSEEFTHFSTASLITRTTNDIQQVQNILTMMMRIVMFAPLMGLTSLFKVIRYRELAGILGWAVVLMIAMMIVVFVAAMPKFRISQKLVDNLNLVTREQLEGMPVIRAFNNEVMEEQRFDKANRDITNLNIFINRLMAVVSPLMTLVMSCVTIAIIWFGASAIDLGTMQIGDMMAFIQYANHVLISFMIVSAILIMLPRASVSANRVFEVLNTEVRIQDPEEPEHIGDDTTITFDHVCFRYPGAEQDVLEDISFTAHPGETVAFIGSTGSGKSTLINLIPRFFDVTGGSIRFGNVDIRNVTQKELRSHIGYIPQKGVLFSGTVESNLRYGDENADPATMERALEVSQAKEFVDRMPSGVQEPISQGGTNVSGGQKQRLSIARALVRKADLYIFDDTFSALDYKTDASLRKALNEMIETTHATVFIVAQRISTIRNADQIIVLDRGRIAGIGKHEQLMKTCSVYQEIASSQLSKEELAL